MVIGEDLDFLAEGPGMGGVNSRRVELFAAATVAPAQTLRSGLFDARRRNQCSPMVDTLPGPWRRSLFVCTNDNQDGSDALAKNWMS